MEKNNKTTGIIIGAVALVLVVGGVFFATNKDSEDTKTESTASSTNMTEQTDKADEKSAGTIVTVASNTPTLSTLVAAVKAAGLVDTLNGSGPFTVFAPTNTAFEALPAGTVDTLLKPENVEQLKSILTYHVVSGKVMSSDLKDGQEVTTVQGEKLMVSIADGKVSLTDAKGGKVTVEAADVPADNGIVHLISGVLMPSK